MESPAFSIPCATYADWRKLVAEFFRQCDAITAAGLDEFSEGAVDAGFKTLALSWIGIQEEPTKMQEYEAMILFQIAGRRMWEMTLHTHV